MKRTAISVAIALCLGLAAAGQAGACSMGDGGKLTTKKTGQPYPGAKGKPWYGQGKPIVLDGASYRKTGAARVFADSEFSYIKKVGEQDGVALYRDDDLPDTLFVPIEAASCTFHAYEKG
ncbi:MAG: hypothetical protein Q7T61_08240 [Caulobacter sp.]|nr:hypothetical protein [Caulobacter sp.]